MLAASFGLFALPAKAYDERNKGLSAGAIFGRGLNTAQPGNAPKGDPFNALNRSEVVAFLAPGVYFVHCNIRGHLLDGMYTYVRVSDDDD